jgi:hypothetical protein
MSRDTAGAQKESPVHNPPRLAAILLLAIGCSLVGAGALLWSRHGAAVFVDNPLLAAIRWCLG